jgi:hypothetical protein
MLLNSWPIRVLISRAARAYGFLDPVTLVAKIRGFAQPSEFSEPIELLRAGMLFHARGLVNTKAIQNNLDWIWPYWVERQFNPADESFIPRAFSFSHINLTHRNWTAVGLPDVPYYPIVDPRGLVTPLFDGWSLDFWLVQPNGTILSPARLRTFSQTLACDRTLHVRSVAAWNESSLESDVALTVQNHQAHCTVTLRPVGMPEGYVAVSIRPYNPEGISFIEKLAIANDRGGWVVNGRHPVLFDRQPERIILSTYKDGDASQRLHEPVTADAVTDSVGMATGVALFPVRLLYEHPLEVRTPIYNELEPKKRPTVGTITPWPEAMSAYAKLRLGSVQVQRLFDLAVANLILHAPDEVYPGPYTYKRFWFRDAAFILNAILALGDLVRARRTLRHFAPRQRHDGYFLSQEGEWDSTGEAIWTYHRYGEVSGETAPDEWLTAVEKGARWIMQKRLPRDTGLPEAGLLPAGFSAEHLGPNDYYYWDDFWGVAGLRCAADLLRVKRPELAAECARHAEEFLATIIRSFPAGPHRRFPGAIPASPKRRMDSGAIGSIVADYPLQLFAPGDPAVLKTADYLRDHSSYEGGFFQNMIHSGINAYLTLHLAQVRLRAGQPEAAWELMDRVAALASPTGQWPEAIHPRTGGGCMGDGEHIWAAAEWALMVRACFLREESDCLVIVPGMKPQWWVNAGAYFGRTLTRFGAVTITVSPAGNRGGPVVAVEGAWHASPPRLDVRLPGYVPQSRPAAHAREEFNLESAS